MPTYSLTAITIGSFALGESDKILTLFSSERGPVRAVAKGARKPGTKISGRCDVLNVNKLLVATGKSLDIITQAEGIENFKPLRQNLERLSYGLYYAELSQHFGQGLSDESDLYFDLVVSSLRAQADGKVEGSLLCLEFELQLLEMLGYKPEVDACVICRAVLTEYLLAVFHYDLGGIICQNCFSKKTRVSEQGEFPREVLHGSASTHITPLVWKRMVLASQSQGSDGAGGSNSPPNIVRANQAARRIIQSYIEYRAGRRMRALDLISQM
jgi:DNA repair protein RecO (recombination protein O)